MAGKRKTYSLDSPVFIQGHVQPVTIKNWHNALDLESTLTAIQTRGMSRWPGFYLQSSFAVDMLEMYTILARHGQRFGSNAAIAEQLMLAAQGMKGDYLYKSTPVTLITEKDRYTFADMGQEIKEMTLGSLMSDMQQSMSARWLCLFSALPYLSGINEHFLYPKFGISATPAALVALSVICGFKITD